MLRGIKLVNKMTDCLRIYKQPIRVNDCTFSVRSGVLVRTTEKLRLVFTIRRVARRRIPSERERERGVGSQW